MEKFPCMASSLPSGQPLDVETNTRAVLARIDEAQRKGATLLALPELCLTGCTAGDLMGFSPVPAACQRALMNIARRTEAMAVALGLPVQIGEKIFNAAALCENGTVKALVLKNALAPDERRIFSPGKEANEPHGFPCPVFREGMGRIRLTSGATLTLRFLENGQPADTDRTVLMHALPSKAGFKAHRRRLIGNVAGRGVCLWANAGANESTTDLVFDGQAIIAQADGVLNESTPFDFQAALWDGASVPAPFDSPPEADPMMPYAPLDQEDRARWCHEAQEICARSLATRLERIRAKGATLGLSGGLDSAMALLTALRAFEIAGLPKESLFAVTLPAFGSGARTRGNAEALLSALGLPLRTIDISRSVLQHFKDIGHREDLLDATFENAQARERTQVLMDKANSLGGLMIGTGDMSELALGFTTFGGDHMSMYSVNAGLYKTALRLIIAQIANDTKNQALSCALLSILDTPVSPELLPSSKAELSQKTEEIVGPYLLNDFFLHHVLLGNASPSHLLEEAQSAFAGRYGQKEIIDRMRGFFSRFFAAQFKRSCMPDGPQVLSVSLSPRGGLHMPSDAACALWHSAIDALEQ